MSSIVPSINHKEFKDHKTKQCFHHLALCSLRSLWLIHLGFLIQKRADSGRLWCRGGLGVSYLQRTVHLPAPEADVRHRIGEPLTCQHSLHVPNFLVGSVPETKALVTKGNKQRLEALVRMTPPARLLFRQLLPPLGNLASPITGTAPWVDLERFSQLSAQNIRDTNPGRQPGIVQTLQDDDRIARRQLL